ncbi:uncharacterized protein PgNI_02760, partial [Pyricularia grisea]|uniref:C2H2-type domain-containing protein n=1 Tax=Pyricularia grisea TaxID=148305 RepID=A0A6P8B9K9_PYRGI
NTPDQQPKKQKTRLRYNWKDCRYNAAFLNKLETHIRQHQKYPKGDYSWEGAENEKKKKRHVWKIYEKWAAQNNYFNIGG